MNNPKAPEFIRRNVALSPTLIDHIASALKQHQVPKIDVAMFTNQSSDDVVVTLSVPFVPKSPTTTLEEFFE
jgi:hypothetical protein